MGDHANRLPDSVLPRRVRTADLSGELAAAPAPVIEVALKMLREEDVVDADHRPFDLPREGFGGVDVGSGCPVDELLPL